MVETRRYEKQKSETICDAKDKRQKDGTKLLEDVP